MSSFLPHHLFLLLAACLPLSAAASPWDHHIRFAALGDSWTSGINYGPPDPAVEYDFGDDKEVCRCRRVKEAYAIQLKDTHQSAPWTNGRTPSLDFVACHGAMFDHIPDQLRRLNHTVAPKFAVMTIGGNDAGFPELLEDCIFQFRLDKDYGPAYPDERGECFKSIQRAKERINAGWFRNKLRDSIQTVLDAPLVRNDPYFRLYVVGYAGLFNHDDDACDAWSFGIIPGKQPPLSRQLRRDLNSIIDLGRTYYSSVVNSEMALTKAKFIDINPVFDGHRFCEPTSERTLDAQVRKSWFYGLTWPGCIPLMAGMNATTDPAKSSSDALAASTFSLMSHTTRTTTTTITTASLSVPEPKTVGQDVTATGFCRNCGDIGAIGEFRRPFHPKPEGHAAMAQFLSSSVLDRDRYRWPIYRQKTWQGILVLLAIGAVVLALIVALAVCFSSLVRRARERRRLSKNAANRAENGTVHEYDRLLPESEDDDHDDEHVSHHNQGNAGGYSTISQEVQNGDTPRQSVN